MAQKRTIKFDVSPGLHDLVAREAALQGMSIAEFAREAVTVRAGFTVGRRGDEIVELTEEAYDAVRRMGAAYPPRSGAPDAGGGT